MQVKFNTKLSKKTILDRLEKHSGQSLNEIFDNDFLDAIDRGDYYYAYKHACHSSHDRPIVNSLITQFIMCFIKDFPDRFTDDPKNAYSECPSFYGANISEADLSNVGMIPEWCFSNCKKLESITIGKTLKSIGDYAFSHCESIESITIPSSITSIGDMAFYDCRAIKDVYYEGDIAGWFGISMRSHSSNPCQRSGTNLYFSGNLVKDVVIPNSVTSIRDFAFYGCESIESITIPSSITSIGDYAFYGCESIKDIYYEGDIIGWLGISMKSPLYREGSRLYFNGKLVNSNSALAIPNSVTSIGDYAFYDWEFLKSVEIPDSVTSIGGHAFSGCKTLKSISIPDGVTSIKEETFCNCYSLESVTIPDTVISIENHSFAGCKSLTSFAIPSHLNAIHGSSFGCTGIQKLFIPSNFSLSLKKAFGGFFQRGPVGINAVYTDAKRSKKLWEIDANEWHLECSLEDFLKNV